MAIPLWQVKTGNPVTPDLYNPETLQASPYFREYIREQDPKFLESDFPALETQKATHEKLISLIASGDFVVHNGVSVPRWAIRDESG